jgi:hypothetical protein
MAAWPTHGEVVELLRLPDDTSNPDAVVEQARLAAIDYCTGRIDPTVWDTGDPSTADVPDGVHTAALLYAARFYRRRDSLDGTIGWGDMGVVRVGVKDNDAEALLAQYLAVVIG